MGTTPAQRKALAAVLAIGAAALGFDRFVIGSGLSGPASASAGAMPPPGEAVDQPVPPVTAAAPASTDAAVSDRLVEATCGLTDDQACAIRDAFDPARLVPASLEQPDPALQAADPTPTAADFVKSHHLGMVMRSDRGGMAVVGDQRLVVGQAIDGWELVAIGRGSATFRDAAGRTAELVMADEVGR